MIEWLTDPLTHGTTLRALAEVFLLGTVGGVVGCWVVLYEISYSAESLAHGVLPGLVAASLLGIPLLAGGAVGILFAALLIAAAARLSPGGGDTAVAVVITSLFGLGVLLALSPSSPPGIQELLFGDLLGASDSDLAVTAAIAGAVLLVLWQFHDRVMAVGFDPGFGSALGLRRGLVNALLLTVVAATILVGVQGLGNLLVAAVLIAPAAAARMLTRGFRPLILTSVAIAIGGGLVGIYLSFYAKLAAGASVAGCLVLAYLTCATVSALFGRPPRAADTGSRGPRPIHDFPGRPTA